MASTSHSERKELQPTRGLPRELPPLPLKTIVVTGGSGFIGGQFVIHLANYYSKQEDPYRYVTQYR
jgi:hypothetical protein